MLDLKNLKIAQFASRETHCFSASLYWKGKRVATISNDGQGGCDNIHWEVKGLESQIAPFLDECSAKEDLGFNFKTKLEIWVCKQIDEQLAMRPLLAQAKKKTVFVSTKEIDKPGAYRVLSTPLTLSLEQNLRKKYQAEGNQVFIITPEFVKKHGSKAIEKAKELLAVG